MPDQYKVDRPVESYRNYYRGEKAYFAKWKNRKHLLGGSKNEN